MIYPKAYEVSLSTRTPFRIGGPQDPISARELPVTMVGDSRVVTGPSLKGALRAGIERYLIDSRFEAEGGAWQDGSLQPCIPSTQPSRDEELLLQARKYSKPCAYPPDPRNQRHRYDTICPCCYFLGAMGLLGFVRVPFLYETPAPAARPELRDRLYSASLDRVTGTVRRGANFPYELVPQGSTFTGTLSVLLEDTVLGWKLGEARPLAAGNKDPWLNTWQPKDANDRQGSLIQEFIIERLESIKLIGGYKSKGCGEVKITVSPL